MRDSALVCQALPPFWISIKVMLSIWDVQQPSVDQNWKHLNLDIWAIPADLGGLFEFYHICSALVTDPRWCSCDVRWVSIIELTSLILYAIPLGANWFSEDNLLPCIQCFKEMHWTKLILLHLHSWIICIHKSINSLYSCNVLFFSLHAWTFPFRVSGSPFALMDLYNLQGWPKDAKIMNIKCIGWMGFKDDGLMGDPQFVLKVSYEKNATPFPY